MRVPVTFLLFAATAFAEVHTMTLRQALDRALQQNPDVILARLDAQKSKFQTEQTRDPFSIKGGVGSGLAYTYGFPSSIDGNAPSLFQFRAQRALYDKPQSYRIEQAREGERGAAIDVALRQQDIAYRVSTAFLDADSAARSAAAAERQYQSLQQIKQFIDVRVADGRELKNEATRANVNALVAQDAAEQFAYVGANSEAVLAVLLGYPNGDRVHPAVEERDDVLPVAQEQAVTTALEQSTELRRLESNLKAKRLEIKSFEGSYLPRITAFSQYSVLAKFNNFLDFYPKFQRNNYQIGASIEFPIFTGKAPKAGKAAAQNDTERLLVEIARTKARISADIDQSYRDVQRAEKARNLRRAVLDLAREDLTIVLVQSDEGRATLAQVEAARAKEQEEWIRYYDAQRVVEIAKLNVRRNTGTILAGVQ
ncbi:MAG: TolC family protein [Candidatus Sumerlaeota bacterium]